MALPKQVNTVYNTTLPSTGEQFKFRAFLVKEQKSLLLAQQSEDAEVMIDTIKTVIGSCCIGNIDVNKLAIFDMEYLFCQIRAKSAGENVELWYYCPTCNDEKAKVKKSIDLTKIEVKRHPEHNNKIELFDSVGVVMKYPSINIMKKIEVIANEDIDAVMDIIVDCIDFIYDQDEIYSSVDSTKEELLQFIENLTEQQFEKIQKFFETMPKLTHTEEFDCPVCNAHHTRTLEGMDSFF